LAIVVLLPLFGMLRGGAFGFPGAAVWTLIVAPVVLVLLARGDRGDDLGEPDA